MSDVRRSGASRQAVVFIRINNMDTLEVESQRTYVIDLVDENLTTEDAFREALSNASHQARTREVYGG